LQLLPEVAELILWGAREPEFINLGFVPGAGNLPPGRPFQSAQLSACKASKARFPARFRLVAAMKPCPCG